jgi:polysaccharide biosynthesis/export protein
MRWRSFCLLALSIPAAACYAQVAQPAASVGAQPAASNAAPSADSKVASISPADPDKPVLPASQPASSNSYILGATDVITVTVLKETTLSSSLLVRPDGMITMPLVGELKAAGLTPLQLSQDIATKLKKYIQDPDVSVVLTAINSKKIYVMGEVTRIGPVDLTPGMTLLEAIASASGLTQYANTRKMYILRDEDGKHTKIPLSYRKALKGDSDLNLTLMPGDTIVVP